MLRPHAFCAAFAHNVPLRSGTFVLRDTQFRWLTRLSQNQMPPQVRKGIGWVAVVLH